MSPRERVIIALEGGEPDRIPCALAFRDDVALDGLLPEGVCEDELIDVRFVDAPKTPGEVALEQEVSNTPFDTRLGTPAQVSRYERWGYHPETPDARNPLAEARTLDDLRAYVFPDPGGHYRVEELREQVEAIQARGLAVGGGLPHLGGELFESAWRLRGLSNFLLDMLRRPDWADYLLDRLAGIARRNAETLAAAGVDVLAIDDDVGIPGTMFISPTLWRRFLKPRMAAIVRAVRTVKPEVRVLYHSDGTIEPILGDLVEIGVNAVNPVQPEHMDAQRVRRLHGRKLALWGTVGRQATFSYGTPEEIHREVRHRIATLGRAGLVLCPAYDVDEPDIPGENLVAFLEAVRRYG